MLLSAGLTWTLSETGPPIRGLPARGRRGDTTDGRLPIERRVAALASRFLADVTVRPELFEAAAPTGPSDTARSAAEAATITDVHNLPLPTPSPSEYYKSNKRNTRRGWAAGCSPGGGGGGSPRSDGGAGGTEVGYRMSPVPLRGTSCGLPRASSVTCRLATRLPTAVGANLRETLQFAPAGIAAPEQVSPTLAKSRALAPLTSATATCRSAVPRFDTVTVRTGPIVFATWSGKETEVGCAWAERVAPRRIPTSHENPFVTARSGCWSPFRSVIRSLWLPEPVQ